MLVSVPAPGVRDLPKIATWTGKAQKEQGPQASLSEEKSTSEVELTTGSKVSGLKRLLGWKAKPGKPEVNSNSNV